MHHPGTAAGAAQGHDLEFLAFEGEMAARIRAFDWSATPLGPAGAWPLSLKTVIRILLTSRYAMWMAWGDTLTFFCNDAYLPTVGIKRDWVLGARSDKVWEEIWPDIGPRIDSVLSTGKATWDEGLPLFLERSGFPEETYHTFSYSPLADDSGAISGMLCVVTEETERVIGERRLSALQALAAGLAATRAEVDVLDAIEVALAAIAKDAPFGLLYLTDEAGSLRLVRAAGMQPGHPAAPFVIDASSPWPAEPAEGQGTVVVSDLRARFGDLPAGAWERPPGQAAVVPIAGQGQGGPIGVLVVGLNPHRAFDGDYAAFLDLFAGQIAAGLASARTFEAERRRAEALAELDRAKTVFFSNVSHEFRTPLTLMMSPLEKALAHPDAALRPDVRALLEVAQRNSVRLLRLVNTLLDFTRIEAGRVQASYVPVDLPAFTAELASNFRSATERAGLALRIDCPPLPEAVHVDREMWEKIVLNLLSNAFKFTFEGGIDVTLRRSGDRRRAVLTVRDTGVGIPADELPRLFERFHRVEGQESRSFEGSGIGLALVQELVRLHGGNIRVASEVGRGTAFEILLPFGTAHLPQDRLGAAQTHVSTSLRASAFVEEALRWLPDGEAAHTVPDLDGSLGGADDSVPAVEGTARLLIADDNADMRDYVRRLLKGWDVEAVADGQAALEAMRARRPDLLLSDVMMPRLDGFGLLRAIRADVSLRDIPVILLSARAGEEARVEGLDAGADDYLTKPFSAKELVARLRANLDLARVRGEVAQALRESEARSHFMIALGDRLRDLREPERIRFAAAEALGTFLGAARCGYAEIDDGGAFATVEDDWTNGTMPSAKGRHRLDDFGPEIIDRYRAGLVDRRDDIRTDPRLGPRHLAAYEAGGDARSGVSVPILKRQRWVALLYVHDDKPRRWTDEEETLIRNVAERTWAAVDQAKAQAALRDSEHRLRAIYDLALDGLFVFKTMRDADGTIRDFVYESVNPAGARLLATTAEALVGRSLMGLWPHHGEPSGLFARYRHVVETGEPHDFELFYEGEGFHGWYRNAAVRLGDGLIVQVADVTPRHLAEEQRTLLINELNHRVKNTLATVQSIAAQTLRGANVEGPVRDALESRLFSLASAHDVLTQQSWEGANLRDIVGKALAPFRSHEGRFDVEGPNVRLPPKAALALAMALHELATNAVKYGALSNATGRVSVIWSVAGGDLLLDWAETGGPPVEPPRRRGFGSRLIERGLAGELNGEAVTLYRGTGVTCSIRAPLSHGQQGFAAAATRAAPAGRSASA